MTGRPLVRLAAGFAVGIAVGLHGLSFPPLLAFALPLALSPPLAPLAFVCAGWKAASAARVTPGAPPGEVVTLSGRVTSVPDRFGDRLRFLLHTTRGETVELTAAPTSWPLALGDRVRARAELRAPPGPRNAGGRDAAARLHAGGVSYQGRAVGPVIREEPAALASWLERGRDRLARAADRVLPAREAGVMRAIATGDRGGVDPDTARSFARSGLAHVLAVSGFHLVVVIVGLERLLRAALVRVDPLAARVDPGRVAALLALPATAVYALATGMGAPVVRSAVGTSAYLVGRVVGRELDGAQGLALAALVLLAFAPASALDPGFQLSFAAVAGLVLWSTAFRRLLPVPPARRGWRALLVEPFLGGAAATLAASLATAPVLAYHFRQLPLLGLAANVAAIPLGAALTALGAVAAAAACAGEALAVPALLVARPLAWALLALSDAAAAPRWGVLGVGSPGAAGVLGAFGFALLAGRLAGTRRWAAALAAALCVLAPAHLRAAAARARGTLEVVFVSVGQGDATLLRLPDGGAVLIDAGGAPDGGPDPGARDVVPLLRDLGVRRLAAAFVSHPHPDHVLGLAAVAEAIPIDRVYTGGDPGAGAAADVLRALAPVPLRPGDAVAIGGVVLEVVGGEEDGTFSTNDRSLVLRLSHGAVAFLFPGDLEGAGEAAAVARGRLAAAVVKVPHHGSRTSSSAPFVAATGARLAVVSLGLGNRFGFPHAEAVDRWRAAGAEVLRTDEGAVHLLSDGRAVRRIPAEAALDPVATWRLCP